MDVILFAGRLLLAVVLGVAGLAKLADRAGARQALAAFGLPVAWASPLGGALPVVEVAVAALLLWGALAWWGAVAALALFGAFSAAVAVNLALGRTPDCHCFGQLHSEPIGWATLVRNGVFAAVAVWLVWQGPAALAASDVRGLVGEQAATWTALGVAVVALIIAAGEGWLLAQLTQQNGRLLLRIEDLEARFGDGGLPVAAKPAQGLAVGSPAPAFRLDGLHGETLTLDALRVAQKPLLLVFVDSQCGPCNALLPEIAGWQRDHAASLTIVPITRGKADQAAEHGLHTMLVQKDAEVAQAYRVAVTPSAVLVRPDGTVGSPLAVGRDAIRGLLRRALGQPEPAPALPPANVHTNGHANGGCNCAQNGSNGNGSRTMLAGSVRRGDAAPAFRLPDLDDTPRDLASFAGQPTLLLFWNPGCGYCRRMLDNLKAWETNPPPGAPKLLIVSTGTPEANRAQGLQSPIVLDTDFAVGRAFGVLGTPSAVLVDANGRIASDVAAGADEVLALARGAPTSVPDAAQSR